MNNIWLELARKARQKNFKSWQERDRKKKRETEKKTERMLCLLKLGRRHIQPRSCMGGAEAVKRVRERSCLWKEKRAQGQLRRSAPKTSLIFSQRTYKFMFKSLIHCELCSVRGVRMDICAASFVCDFFQLLLGSFCSPLLCSSVLYLKYQTASLGRQTLYCQVS